MLEALALATAAPVDAYYREALRDYDSAKIEVIREPYPDTWRIRCGILQMTACKKGEYPATVHCYRVNAKNAYGAYTGWVYWWLAEVGGKIFSAGDDRYGIEKYCGFDPGRSQN